MNSLEFDLSRISIFAQSVRAEQQRGEGIMFAKVENTNLPLRFSKKCNGDNGRYAARWVFLADRISFR